VRKERDTYLQREKERERQTEIHTYRERKSEKRERYVPTKRERVRKERDRQTEIHTYREREADRQTYDLQMNEIICELDQSFCKLCLSETC